MSFDHRLRQQFLNAERQMPDSSVDWATTIARGKRERLYRSALVAAAAVLFIGGGALTASGLLDADPVPGPGPAGTPDTEPTPQPAPSATETPVGETSEAVDPAQAGGVVLDWAKALSLGDAETAWEMLSQPARDYYGSFASFETDAMPELAEGWGSWYSSSDSPQTDTRVLVSSGDGSVGVVTVYGQVMKEGTTEFSADAIAFRTSRDAIWVEPHSSKIEIIPWEPSHNDSWEFDAPAAQFRAEVPADVTQVNFLVAGDGRGVNDAELKKQERSGAQPANLVATSHYTAPLAAGPHFVTIAAVDATGKVALEVVPFFVEPK